VTTISYTDGRLRHGTASIPIDRDTVLELAHALDHADRWEGGTWVRRNVRARLTHDDVIIFQPIPDTDAVHVQYTDEYDSEDAARDLREIAGGAV
jgi:hypothetical protein